MKKIYLFFFSLLFLLLARPAFGTTVFSPLLEMSVDPGNSQKGILKIYNETAAPITLTSSVEPFQAAGENGQPHYLAPSERDIYLKWFNISSPTLVLLPREAVLVPFAVTPPANAAPGGYYAVIFWQSNGTAGAPVSLSSKVGTLIFLTVNGVLKETGDVVDFSTTAKSDFIFSRPVNFIVRFSNSGNVHLAPSGTIEVRSWFGRETVLPVNQEKKLILPDSRRRFDEVWHNLPPAANVWQSFWQQTQAEFDEPAAGYYTATLRLTYGSAKTQEVVKQIGFWVIPWHLILSFVVLAIIFLALLKIRNKVNGFKKQKNNSADVKKIK